MNDKERVKTNDAESIVKVVDEKMISLNPQVRHGHKHAEQLFAFDRVFGPEASQQFVYEKTAKEMLPG